MKKFLLLTFLILIALAVLLAAIAPGMVEKSTNVIVPHEPYKISAEAQKLHNSLFIADLHSDSLLWKRDLSDRANRGHVDLPRLREGNVGLQVFSAVSKTPSRQNDEKNSADTDMITSLVVAQTWPLATWGSLFERANYQLDKLLSLANEEANQLVFIRTKNDFDKFLQARSENSNVIGSLYLIEGAHALEGDISKLNRLQEKGLQFVGLTHFFDNELGGSLHGVSQQGLTKFGRDVVKRADDLQMTIDIAHASPQMVRDVLKIVSRPVILSHGGFKGACNKQRNLSDELMKEMAAAGGIIGVGYWSSAVCDVSPAGIVKSIRYGIDLLGIDHIALGSDFDGGIAAQLDTSELAVLTQTMLDQKFSEAEIRAVMGENIKHFLKQQLP